MKLKRIIGLVLLLAASLFASLQPGSIFAQEKKVNIYFFWGDGCPHCTKEKPFLEGLKSKYPGVEVHSYEVWYQPENQELLKKVAEKLNTSVSGVPFTVVGERYFSGFAEGSTDRQIEGQVKNMYENGGADPIATVVGVAASSSPSNASTSKPKLGPDPAPSDPEPKEEPNTAPENDVMPISLEDSFEDVKAGEDSQVPEMIRVPLLGEINTKSFSLLVLTVVLGALDGFNPCAMWTLLFLISLLIGMQDKKRMWMLGSAFIVASASVYFVFMAAWLNLLLFLGFVVWVRAMIGVVALVGGGYNLKEYLTNKDAACKVTKSEKRKKVFDDLKRLTHEKTFLIALGGIVLLAIAVNLVELICSAGLPAVYTQILAISNLSTVQHYLYILLYIFFFMLDDLIVFFAAMTTLQMTGLTTKYSRFSHLIGGILMVIIGLLLIFKPEWLMFG